MKKKILFVNGHLNVGGIEKSLTDLLNHLDYHKYEVDLLLLEEKGDYLPQIPKAVNIIFVDTTKAYGPLLKSIFSNLLMFRWTIVLYRIILSFANKYGKQYLWILRGILSLKSTYDVAIAYRTGVCADIVAYTAKAHKKIVWWHHGEINISSSDINAYNRTWQYFDSVVTVSSTCKKNLEHTFNYPSNKIVVIPNMIDRAQILRKAGQITPYKDKTHTKIISVGRLCTEKHFENIVFVAKELLKGGIKDFHWYIIGDGDLRERLEAIVNEQNVKNYVTLLGKKDNPYPWMKYADIYVHPSYVESQGLTILEAMTLNIPCVICRSNGPAEYIIDGLNAIMTEPNPICLYKGVLKMISYKDKSSFTREAQKMVKDKFSPQNVIKLFNNQIVI